MSKLYNVIENMKLFKCNEIDIFNYCRVLFSKSFPSVIYVFQLLCVIFSGSRVNK